MYTWYVLTITFVSEWTMVVVELSVFFCPSSWWHMHPQDHRLWHSRVRSIYSWMMVDVATYFEKVEAYICVSNYPVPSTHYLCNSGISKLKHSLYSHQYTASRFTWHRLTWCVHFDLQNKDEWKANNAICQPYWWECEHMILYSSVMSAGAVYCIYYIY